MKRYYLIGLFYLFAINIISGQLSLEVLSGANIAWQTSKFENFAENTSPDTFDENFNNVFTPFLGLQLSVKANSYLDVNFEFQYSLQGQTLKSYGNSEISHYLKYLQTIEFKIIDELKLGGGMFWGYRVKSDYINYGPNAFLGREEWDNGAIVSISYKINRVSFRLAYYYSFKSAHRISYINSQGIFIGTINKKNRVFQLGIGYTLKPSSAKSSPKS